MRLDCNQKTPEEIEKLIDDEIKNKEFINTIVTIRLVGTLKSGRASDINFKEIFKKFYDKSAYYVMKSTTMLESEEFKEVKIEHKTVEDVEDSLIKEHLGAVKINELRSEDEEKLTKDLIKILALEKAEDERVFDFERKIKEEVDRVLGSHDRFADRI